MVCRLGIWVICFLGLLPAAICQVNAHKPSDAPSLPFYDWKACPFEGCSYQRRWTAQKKIPVYDTWRTHREQVALLSKGDSVFALTGVVITIRPGIIRLDSDLPKEHLKQGETILTYAYRGEGYSAVWFQGQYHPEFDISFVKWPDGSGCGGEAPCAATYVDMGKKAWWAKVKLKSGRIGWINMETANFTGADGQG